MNRARLLLLLSGLLFLMAQPSHAQVIDRVEVVEVSGIIDSSVERTILSVLEDAEQQRATMVVLQIDSRGVVGEGRAKRIGQAIVGAMLPVVTWVGPAGAHAANGALVIVNSGIATAAPGAIVGPLETADFRTRIDTERPPNWIRLAPADIPNVPIRVRDGSTYPFLRIAPSLQELIAEVPRPDYTPDEQHFDTSNARTRLHQLDLLGRLLHAAAQPSITYLLLLLALVGIVFELFHPSTGPAGVAGLAALALALYGIATLGGSWLGFALIVAGVALFAVDLRFQSLGPLTALGFAGLVAGSLLLFRSPWLRVSPWVLAFGITGMVLFLVGAMTRVLRDLRAVASGALEVQDAHPHPNGQGD